MSTRSAASETGFPSLCVLSTQGAHGRRGLSQASEPPRGGHFLRLCVTLPNDTRKCCCLLCECFTVGLYLSHSTREGAVTEGHGEVGPSQLPVRSWWVRGPQGRLASRRPGGVLETRPSERRAARRAPSRPAPLTAMPPRKGCFSSKPELKRLRAAPCRSRGPTRAERILVLCSGRTAEGQRPPPALQPDLNGTAGSSRRGRRHHSQH